MLQLVATKTNPEVIIRIWYHTNKTLRKLAERGLIQWLDRGCEVLDAKGLQAVANWNPGDPKVRPLI